jgi:Spy/CpxP family protein refolding chaperone
MSRIHTIALGLALCAGAAVTAGAQTASASPKASASLKSDTTAVTRHGNHQMRRGGMDRGDRMLFKGINLTSTQRTQVDSIRSRYRSESKSLHEQMAPEMKDARAARQSGDSAKVKEARQNMSASRDTMMTLRKQEIGEIRGVLTQEQQSTFDKNVTEMQSRMRNGRGGRRGARSGNTKS